MFAPRNPLSVAALVSLWLAAFANWPLWRALAALPELASARGALFMFSFGLMMAGVHLALLALGAWPRLIKPLSLVLLTAAAAGAHFMGSYHVVIDPSMMLNVLHTDVHEAGDLIGAPLLGSLLLLAGLPAWWLWRTPLRPLPLRAQALRNAVAVLLALWLAGGLGVLNFAPLSSTMRNHKALRYMVNPANSVYALARLGLQRGVRPAAAAAAIGADASAPAPRGAGRPPLLMLVIGETARPDHFSLNGYARPTNAETAALGVISFTDVSACGTSTAASLPCMFSHLGRARFGARDHDYQNLLDVAQQAGLAVLWLDNQAGCKGVCERVPHAVAAQAPAGSAHASGVCDGQECLDEALLTGLDQRLAALPAERRQRGVLLVLHQMGSHGPAYYKRSPAARKPFQPECRSHALQECAPEALVNAYDNSIAYTDHVLAGAIDWLQRQRAHYDPMLLYVSDHGESLGEDGLYLHGLPYAMAPRAQTQVPLLLWLPPQSEAAIGAARECLLQHRDQPLSHDHLFHSVGGLLGLRSQVFDAGLDLAAPCRGA